MGTLCHLGFILFSLCEIPNETTGVPPQVLAFGHLPRGPLAVLKETWGGEIDLPLNLGKNVTDLMQDLKTKLSVAQEYATSHSDRAQARYAVLSNKYLEQVTIVMQIVARFHTLSALSNV